MKYVVVLGDGMADRPIEELNGKKFGDTEDPLLVSVRSGSRASMPGMIILRKEARLDLCAPLQRDLNREAMLQI